MKIYYTIKNSYEEDFDWNLIIKEEEWKSIYLYNMDCNNNKMNTLLQLNISFDIDSLKYIKNQEWKIKEILSLKETENIEFILL